MANESAEDIAHLEQLILTLRRRLRVLEMQAAGYGALAVPPHIVLELEDIRRELPQKLADLRRLRPGPVADRSPYLGLLTFQEANADLFFGRDALVADLVERVQRAPFLAVLGASGSGKSSVVRAGLISMLKGGALLGSENWRYITLKPGARPLDTLAAELAKLHGDPTAVVRYGETLSTSERALLLLADALLDRAAGQRLVLVVDQFEELWTLTPAEGEPRAAFLAQQQRPFIRLLLTAITAPDTPLLVVVAMRADFLHRAADDPALARAIGEHDLIVSPMTRAELRDAIVRPAELAGGDFEPGLVDELVEQGQQGALPLLEYTLDELWKERQPNGMMTWAAYRDLGGVEGALAVRADAILTERYTADQRDELRQVLLRLVQPGEGAADTRRRMSFEQLVPVGQSPETLYALLKPLIDERLLTSGRDVASGEETVEVSHEALIRVWPMLSRWIDEARADLRFQLQLEEDAREWQASDANEDLLWRGLRLSNAAAWLERARPRLNARDQGFLDASRAAEQAGKDAEEAAGRRLQRRAIYLAGALVVALIAAIGAGWFGLEAQRASTLALARQLAALAERDAITQPDRALLLSVEANQLTDEVQVRSALLNALVANERLTGFMRGHTNSVWSVVFSPDGRMLASASADQSIRLWDVASRQLLDGPLTGHTNDVNSVAFSPDGRTLASASSDQSIRLWDVASRQPLGQPLTGHTDDVNSVAFSPDGTTLASASGDGSIRLWDVASRQPLGEPFTGHSSAVYSVAFSPDGTTLASASDDASIWLWDVASRQPLGKPLTGHTNFVLSVAFSPDGRILASASGDGSIRLWDVTSRQPLGKPLTGHTNFVLSVAFSPDGRTLASASDDGSIRLWDVASRQPVGTPFIGHTDTVQSLAFSSDGRTLASASNDGSIRLWDVTSRQPLGTPLIGHTDTVWSIAFSPDGRTLASASDDGSIRLWDTASRQPLGTPFIGHTDYVRSVTFSSDGKLLASANDDGSIQLWDVASRQPLGEPLIGYTYSVWSVAFSPDGRILASATFEGSIQLWDVASRQLLGEPLIGHTGSVLSVAFSPDGTTLASTSGKGSLQLWDVASRQPLGTPLIGHTNTVYSAAFSPDGRTLASASDDGSIWLWDVASRQPLGEPLIGHTDAVYSVAFSPDSTILASASGDGSIRLWDVASRQPLGEPLTGHTGYVRSVAFSSDGRTLASASFDNTIRLWPMSVESWIARACRIAGRNLTQTEWNQFVSPDRPYHRTCAEFPPGEGAPANAP